jgi:uncharacterized oxidoreductase
VIRVAADKLADLIAAVCRRSGSEEDEAQLVARHLVASNLAGHDSHGVGMLPTYIDHALDGRLKLNGHARAVQDSGPVLLIDGGMGHGHVIAYEAMQMGLAKAREHGLALVGLRNSHHIGRIGAWGEMCAEAGFISIHWVNAMAHKAIVAPWGGTDARFVTNPYCTAIPATDGGPPIILDFATSKIAMGKVRVAYNKGVEAPPGALIDHRGRPTRDPGVMFREPRGALLSMGEHKGYGLAMICDVLAGALTGGGAYLPERSARETIQNNMLTVIVDPNVFGDAEGFRREIDAYVAWVKASPPQEGVGEVMAPGDPERKSRAERGASGVPIDERSWEELVAAAAMVGLARSELEDLAAAR